MQFLLQSPEVSVDQLRVLSHHVGPPLVDIKSCVFFWSKPHLLNEGMPGWFAFFVSPKWFVISSEWFEWIETWKDGNLLQHDDVRDLSQPYRCQAEMMAGAVRASLALLTRKKENQSQGSWHLAWTTGFFHHVLLLQESGVNQMVPNMWHNDKGWERHMLIRFPGCHGYTCHIQSTLQVFQSQCTWESHHPSTRNIQEKTGLLVQRRPGFDRIW